MQYLETNIRFILGQKCFPTNDLIEIIDKNEKLSKTTDHERFDMAGNRDSNESYFQNIKVLRLFPDLPVKIKHDYNDEYNDYYKPTYWLYFHKGQILFENCEFEEIKDFSGDGTVEILKYLIRYFGIERYFRSPFDLINK